MQQDRFIAIPTLTCFSVRQASKQPQSQAAFRAMREMVKIRTKYFDDVLERQLSSGCRQVVLLGAGLDTRAVRKSAGDVRYFEIDNAATLSLKQRCFDAQGIHPNVRF